MGLHDHRDSYTFPFTSPFRAVIPKMFILLSMQPNCQNETQISKDASENALVYFINHFIKSTPPWAHNSSIFCYRNNITI
jgi:hypothetical protein